ncbi:MAG: hypothetical protein LBS41_05465 [Streptococcaceae bacterium]|nr:hypothetical protein [Streptococcaceae bacterium]
MFKKGMTLLVLVSMIFGNVGLTKVLALSVSNQTKQQSELLTASPTVATPSEQAQEETGTKIGAAIGAGTATIPGQVQGKIDVFSTQFQQDNKSAVETFVDNFVTNAFKTASDWFKEDGEGKKHRAANFLRMGGSICPTIFFLFDLFKAPEKDPVMEKLDALTTQVSSFQASVTNLVGTGNLVSDVRSYLSNITNMKQKLLAMHTKYYSSFKNILTALNQLQTGTMQYQSEFARLDSLLQDEYATRAVPRFPAGNYQPSDLTNKINGGKANEDLVSDFITLTNDICLQTNSNGGQATITKLFDEYCASKASFNTSKLGGKSLFDLKLAFYQSIDDSVTSLFSILQETIAYDLAKNETYKASLEKMVQDKVFTRAEAQGNIAEATANIDLDKVRLSETDPVNSVVVMQRRVEHVLQQEYKQVKIEMVDSLKEGKILAYNASGGQGPTALNKHIVAAPAPSLMRTVFSYNIDKGEEKTFPSLTSEQSDAVHHKVTPGELSNLGSFSSIWQRKLRTDLTDAGFNLDSYDELWTGQGRRDDIGGVGKGEIDLYDTSLADNNDAPSLNKVAENKELHASRSGSTWTDTYQRNNKATTLGVMSYWQPNTSFETANYPLGKDSNVNAAVNKLKVTALTHGVTIKQSDLEKLGPLSDEMESFIHSKKSEGHGDWEITAINGRVYFASSCHLPRHDSDSSSEEAPLLAKDTTFVEDFPYANRFMQNKDGNIVYNDGVKVAVFDGNTYDPNSTYAKGFD